MLGRGDVATADLRYSPSDFGRHNHVIHHYTGPPVLAYPYGTTVTIYRQDGSVYSGTVTDNGSGFAAPRPEIGLPKGVSGYDWFDIWDRRTVLEWDLVRIQAPAGH
jgi:hypothetical protein